MQSTTTQKYIFLLLLLCQTGLGQYALSQSYTRVTDSLLQLTKVPKSAEAQIDLYNEIAYNYRRYRPDSLLYFAELALTEAKKADYERGMMLAYKHIGIYRFKQEFPSDSIIQSYQLAAVYAEKANDIYQQAALANNIGLVKNTQNRINEAISYFLKGLSILKENQHPASRLEGLINGNLSKCYRDRNDLEKAKSYLDACFEVANAIPDESLLSIYGDNYGGILIDLGQEEAGMNYLNAIIPLQQSLSDYQSLCQSYMELSEQYLKQGDLANAEKYILLAQMQGEENGFKSFETGIYLLLAQISLAKDLPEEAIQFGQRGIAAAQFTDKAFYTSTCYQVLSEAYVRLNQYEQAFEMQIEHELLKEEINETEKAILADELEAQYQLEEQQRQIETLNELQLAQRRLVNFLIIIVVLIIALLLVVSSAFYSNRRKQQIISHKNEQLQLYIDQNLQLENFVHLASHDLKSPLRNITSFAQLLKRKLADQDTSNVDEYLHYIIKAGDGLSHLVEDLLQYSIISKKPNEVDQVDIPNLLDEVLEGITSIVETTRAEISIELEQDVILGDETKLKQLFQNLILNAIKFQKPGNNPVVRIVGKDQNDYWLFTIEDNGIGIESEYQDQIFLMLKRLHTSDRFEGTGIGLAICKSIVEQHGGRIWVSSAPEVGSVFHFLLAKEPQAIDDQDIALSPMISTYS